MAPSSKDSCHKARGGWTFTSKAPLLKACFEEMRRREEAKLSERQRELWGAQAAGRARWISGESSTQRPSTIPEVDERLQEKQRKLEEQIKRQADQIVKREILLEQRRQAIRKQQEALRKLQDDARWIRSSDASPIPPNRSLLPSSTLPPSCPLPPRPHLPSRTRTKKTDTKRSTLPPIPEVSSEDRDRKRRSRRRQTERARRETAKGKAPSSPAVVEPDIQSRIPVRLGQIPFMSNENLLGLIGKLNGTDRIQLALMLPEVFLSDSRINLINLDPLFLRRYGRPGEEPRAVSSSVVDSVLRGIVENIRALVFEIYRNGLRHSLPIVVEALASTELDNTDIELIRYLVYLGEPLSAERINRIASRSVMGAVVVLAAALEKRGFYTRFSPGEGLIPADSINGEAADTRLGEELLLQLADLPQPSLDWTRMLFSVSRDSQHHNIHGRLLSTAVRDRVDSGDATISFLVTSNCPRSLQALYYAVLQSDPKLIGYLLDVGYSKPILANITSAPPAGFSALFPGGAPLQGEEANRPLTVTEARRFVDFWAAQRLPLPAVALKIGDDAQARWLQNRLDLPVSQCKLVGTCG